MKAIERRQAMLELLCERRHEKIENLAFEFGVGRKTIMRDVLELSLSYPIYTITGSHNGGVFVSEDYYIGKQYLSKSQQLLLESLMTKCDDNDKKIMQSIIKKFGKQKSEAGQ